MKAIYKFFWDCGRMGDVMGVFVSTPEAIKLATDNKTYVYFGEILGKHSEVYGNLSSEDFTLITDNQEFIKLFQEYDLSNGYNPFDYIEESEDDNQDVE